MLFKPTPLYQYYKRYSDLKVTPVHQSNPQPFTMAELELIIGKQATFIEPNFELSYASLHGDIKLREAITHLYQHDNPEEIVTFVGAQEAIFCFLYSLLKPQDKVVAITPIFEPLLATAREIGCDIDLVSLHPNEFKWALDLDELEATVKKGCKLLIINFPHNPTGAMLTENELLKIIEICDKNNCWILSDEVFRGLEYQSSQRLPAVADLYPRAISISVLSKSFATPALRLGWVSCQDQNILERMVQIKSSFSICTSHLDEQFATQIILHHEQVWERSTKRIQKNLASFKSHQPNSQLIASFIKPKAACVGFPLLNESLSATEFSEELIYSKKLMTLPAELFLTSYNGIRLGFGYDKSSRSIEDVFCAV